jgi:hypothetical protein
MKRANPNKKFYWEDLIPEPWEVGNAMWGAHIGNNFERVLGVDGTIFIPAVIDLQTGQTGKDRIYYLPVNSYQFHAIPIVQIISRISVPYSGGTTFANDAIDVGWTLRESLNSSDTQFWALYYSNSLTPPPVLKPENIFRIGLSQDELIRVITHEVTDRTAPNDVGTWISKLNVARGVSPYTGIDTYLGGNKLYRVTQWAGTFLNGTMTYTDLNPPFAQVVFDGQSLIFNWMHDAGGTIYYKVFGA